MRWCDIAVRTKNPRAGPRDKEPHMCRPYASNVLASSVAPEANNSAVGKRRPPPYQHSMQGRVAAAPPFLLHKCCKEEPRQAGVQSHKTEILIFAAPRRSSPASPDIHTEILWLAMQVPILPLYKCNRSHGGLRVYEWHFCLQIMTQSYSCSV